MLRHYTLQAHLAGVTEDCLTVVVLHVLIEAQTWCSLGQHRGERSLAHLKRLASQIVAIQLDQVEGVEKHAGVVSAVADAVERCEPVIIAGDSFPIDDTGA